MNGVDIRIRLTLLAVFTCLTSLASTGCLLHMQDPSGQSRGSENKQEWALWFSQHGRLEEKEVLPFQFELFINGRFDSRIRSNIEYLRHRLEILSKNLGPEDWVELVLINPRREVLQIVSSTGQQTVNDYEIKLAFYPGVPSSYTISTTLLQAEAWHGVFVYVEKSDGIQNLRHLQRHLDSLVVTGTPFLVYFNGPGNRPVIASRPEQLTSLYNQLFTSITQPPRPADELQSVYDVLMQFLPQHTNNASLTALHYLSEPSYSLLRNRFLIPLWNTYLPAGSFLDRPVYIFTDFDVQDTHELFIYKNIIK